MIIKREIEGELVGLMKEYPVVTLTGPRQTGKTTLARSTFSKFSYCNLEKPEIRNLAENDVNALFDAYPPPAIIDEIQRVPQLLSHIQSIVDEKKENGLFLLTGSHQLTLNQEVTQTLAGRTALLTLLPFTISELNQYNISYDRDRQIYTGFLPRIYDQKQNPTKTYRNYLQTYIERDLRLLLKVKDLRLFENFLYLLAGRTGQLVNLSSIANDLGVSSETLRHWLSILEASFIVFLLYPYYENFGKRIIKSSKIYFIDPGLAAYLLGIENASQVARDPLLGGLFENMVIMEAVKHRLNKGLDPKLFFYRDNNDNEIDLLYKKHNTLIPIEIKAAKTFNEHLTKGIHFMRKISKKTAEGYLIYAGDLTFKSDAYSVLHFSDTKRVF
jgi:predicted AAA+ superfamily ATPase